jgi:hypothetical protein
MSVKTFTTAAFMSLAAVLAAAPVSAQVMAPAQPQMPYASGARPGNEIGTGQSLPLSNNASNMSASDTASVIAPRLPSPPLSDASSPRDFLMAARQALAGNRTGEAQEALERAESRSLDGNILASQISMPSQQMAIRNIANARQALATGDKMAAMQAIETALQGM